MIRNQKWPQWEMEKWENVNSFLVSRKKGIHSAERIFFTTNKDRRYSADYEILQNHILHQKGYQSAFNFENM